MCLCFVGNESRDAKLKKSVCAGYSTELICIMVHFSENVDFFLTHRQTLLSLATSGMLPKVSKNIWNTINFVVITLKKSNKGVLNHRGVLQKDTDRFANRAKPEALPEIINHCRG